MAKFERMAKEKMMAAEEILVFCTAPNMDVAKKIARALVEKKVAACVSLLPGLHSTYRWQGKVEEAEEISMQIKTSRARYKELEQSIQSLHPYDVPEIVAVDIQDGLPAYLAWVKKETG